MVSNLEVVVMLYDFLSPKIDIYSIFIIGRTFVFSGKYSLETF